VLIDCCQNMNIFFRKSFREFMKKRCGKARGFRDCHNTVENRHLLLGPSHA
jgi:hypothetical protein